jgi:23S rRNA (guanosine2251-2'-O)-methyltransferase
MRKLKMDELGRMSVEEFKDTSKTPIAIVLDDVRSALNVGSAFRTADAFACAEMILCGFTAQPPHREILKTALGSTDSVAWRHFQETDAAIALLKQEGYTIIAIEQAENPVYLEEIEDKIKPHTAGKYALVFGNEVEGVSENAMKNADFVVEIPQFGTKHSLNIAVTVGIVCWEFVKILRREL